MEDKTAIQRISDEFDPERCQYTRPTVGQCLNKAAPGCKFCIPHGGVSQKSKQDLKNYRINKYNARLGDLRHNDELKSLRDEVAILRILLEEKFNACSSANELILQSGSMSDLVLKIEKLVSSCHRLEQSMDITIDKSRVVSMAENIVTLISRYVKDDAIIANIVNDMTEMLNKTEEKPLTREPKRIE